MQLAVVDLLHNLLPLVRFPGNIILFSHSDLIVMHKCFCTLVQFYSHAELLPKVYQHLVIISVLFGNLAELYLFCLQLKFLVLGLIFHDRNMSYITCFMQADVCYGLFNAKPPVSPQLWCQKTTHLC